VPSFELQSPKIEIPKLNPKPKLKLKLFLPICRGGSAGLIILGMNRSKYRWWLAAALLLLATLAIASKQYMPPKAFPAKTYPARDEHPDEKITIAADPYDMPDKAAPVFTLPYKDKGYLPIYLVITNDGDQPVVLNEMEVKLVTASRAKLQPATTEDLYRRFSRLKHRGDEVSRNPLPIPLPRHPDAGLPKGGGEEIQNAQFGAKAVEPHGTQAGFLFFDIGGISQPLAGAHLYVTRVRDSNGSELMFFDIALEKYLTYKPGSSGK
jgi:hypothetical protein